MGIYTNNFTDKKGSTYKSQGGPYERSADYRRDYLKKHKGFFGIYTCAYCGRLITKSNMQVDHIYPVNRAATRTSGKVFVTLNSFWRGKKGRNQGVNGNWNKTAACPKCNNLKSDKGGLCVTLGYLGRIINPIIKIAEAGVIGYTAINALVFGGPTAYMIWAIAGIVGFEAVRTAIVRKILKAVKK